MARPSPQLTRHLPADNHNPPPHPCAESPLSQESRTLSSSSCNNKETATTPDWWSCGATIKRDEETGEIYIARVIHGGLADRSVTLPQPQGRDLTGSCDDGVGREPAPRE
ncbi:unnamed protein product [Boreogadus saida]